MDEPRRMKVKVKLEDGSIRKGELSADKRKVKIKLDGQKKTFWLKTKWMDEATVLREVLAQGADGNFLIENAGTPVKGGHQPRTLASGASPGRTGTSPSKTAAAGKAAKINAKVSNNVPKKRRGGGAKINSPWDARVAKTLAETFKTTDGRRKGKGPDLGWQSDVG
jgi:hypothetical protein